MLYGKDNARVQVIWFPPQPFESPGRFLQYAIHDNNKPIGGYQCRFGFGRCGYDDI